MVCVQAWGWMSMGPCVDVGSAQVEHILSVCGEVNRVWAVFIGVLPLRGRVTPPVLTGGAPQLSWQTGRAASGPLPLPHQQQGPENSKTKG